MGILNLGGNSAYLILLEKGTFISPKGLFQVSRCFPFFNFLSSFAILAILAIWFLRRLDPLCLDQAIEPLLFEVSDSIVDSSRFSF